MGTTYKKWLLDGSQKTSYGNVACVPGQLKAYLAYTIGANEQSVIITL